MDNVYKNKTREEIIQLVCDLTLQNTNGRETHEEMYLKGIEACYDELLCEDEETATDGLTEMTPTEQELYELRELIAELRDVFPFPMDKCYDEGYSMDNKDGWGYGALMSSPTDCINEIINVCKNKTICGE